MSRLLTAAEEAGSPSLTPAEKARAHYEDPRSDLYYYHVWGGEDIHVGIYDGVQKSVYQAGRLAVRRLAELMPFDIFGKRILDLGSGYGGSARYLAKVRRAHVDCLNLSEIQNARNRHLNKMAMLSHRIEVFDGSFQKLPFPDDCYDAVWSQDALFHSGDRSQVLEEVDRVLKPGGHFVFTDPMQPEGSARNVLGSVLRTMSLSELASPSFYSIAAEGLGWKHLGWQDLSDNLTSHFQAIGSELEKQERRLEMLCGQKFVRRMKDSSKMWMQAAEASHLCWGNFHFQKALS